MADQKKFLDYEGVKYLWSKINMQDYPNNETLMDVIEAIDETKVDKSELVQSDWNQNDETAPDFIKNKPDAILRSEIEEVDAIELVTETGLVSPTTAEDGSIYTDENGVLYSL